MGIWVFGLTVALVGSGGTILVLWLMSLVILLLRTLFPFKPEETKAPKG
jgi:hypothetical protein